MYDNNLPFGALNDPSAPFNQTEKKEDTAFCFILDYTNGLSECIEIPESWGSNEVELFLTDIGYKINDIYYVITGEQKTIYNHYKDLL